MVATKKTVAGKGKTGKESAGTPEAPLRWPELGKIVDEKLTKAGLSNAAAARLSGLGVEMVRRYRKGEAMPERGDNLDKLSKLIGVDIEQLLMADRQGGGTKVSGSRLTRPDPDAIAMLEEYAQLPTDAKKLARARIIELLEEFGKPSKKNPFGKGTQ